ncbi:MAG: 3-oxoadipate enol-lactonase [Nocardioides sp.]
MPDTVRLHHVVDGDTGPAVVLGASLGTDLGLWDRLAADLARDHRVVRFDTRGHGRSPAPEGGYTVEGLAADVVGLADELGIDRFAYVGLSLGGAIGQVLALAHPQRLSSLVLACTSPVFGEPATWRERAASVRRDGLEPLVEPTFDRWFTEEFRAQHPDEVAWVRDMFVATPRPGYAGCCEALATYDVTDRLGRIETPTRVVMGAEDPGTTPEVGRAMVAAIRNADLVVIDGAAHIANLARPEEFRSAVRAHLAATSG